MGAETANTEHDDVNARLVELLRHRVTTFACPVVGVVNDDLPTRVEEVPDELFASRQDLLSQGNRFWALFSLFDAISTTPSYPAERATYRE